MFPVLCKWDDPVASLTYYEKSDNPLKNEKPGRQPAKGYRSPAGHFRLTVGASDLNSFVYSYNDLPQGETDYNLEKFDLGQDRVDVIPVMKEILALNPGIRIMASPWSAPAWMKETYDVRGGHLRKDCYGVYALYFVKYLQEMKKEGINIDAITLQNEPLNSRNTPSMPWLPEEQEEFLSQHLLPALRLAGLNTKLILFDHNLDRIDYPLSLLENPVISEYADGSGFHHYAGSIEAMTTLHLARPDKNLYFTEQMVIEDPESKEIAIAHASKFVLPGSVRIASTNRGDRTVELTRDEQRQMVRRVAIIEDTPVLPNVAFRTPDDNIVLIVANNTYDTRAFQVQCNGRYALIRLEPGAAGTYIWHADPFQ